MDVLHVTDFILGKLSFCPKEIGRISGLHLVCDEKQSEWARLGSAGSVYHWCSGFVSRSMNRLASFKGPSSPSSSPARAQPPSAPPSPSRLSETTHHRKVRALLRELQTTAQTWDNLVLIDGLTAAQSLIDTRTELECVLIMFPTPFNDESLLVMTSLCLQLRAFLLWG